MAKDKRHPVGVDMNDISPSDGSALTDQELEKLQMLLPAMIHRGNNKPKRAM
jgi:hypothetical protein